MKILKKLKDNKAVTLTDVIIGMLILITFTGILTTSFYNIYRHNMLAKVDAVAINYAVIVLEATDKMKYEDVVNDLDINEMFDIPEEYQVSLDVENFNENKQDMQDLIKILTVNVEYDIFGETKIYSVQKLKIKEL